MSKQPRDVEFIHSNFGGGWIVPKSARAREVLAEYFNEPPNTLAPIGGAIGTILCAGGGSTCVGVTGCPTNF